MKTAARVAPAAEVREFPDYRGDFCEKTLVVAAGGRTGAGRLDDGGNWFSPDPGIAGKRHRIAFFAKLRPSVHAFIVCGAYLRQLIRFLRNILMVIIFSKLSITDAIVTISL